MGIFLDSPKKQDKISDNEFNKKLLNSIGFNMMASRINDTNTEVEELKKKIESLEKEKNKNKHIEEWYKTHYEMYKNTRSDYDNLGIFINSINKANIQNNKLIISGFLFNALILILLIVDMVFIDALGWL